MYLSMNELLTINAHGTIDCLDYRICAPTISRNSCCYFKSPFARGIVEMNALYNLKLMHYIAHTVRVRVFVIAELMKSCMSFMGTD